MTSSNRNARMTTVLAMWFFTNIIGSVLAVLALREVAANWLALKRVKTANSDILAEILVGNMYQQTARLVMEGLCWTAGLIVYAVPTPPRRGASTTVVSWMLIAFRGLLVFNNAVEYLSNRHRRQQLYRRRVTTT